MIARRAASRLTAGLRALATLAVPAAVPLEAEGATFTESAVSFGIDTGDSMSFTAGFVDFDGDSDPDFFANNHWRTEGDLYRNDSGVFVETSAHYAGADRDRHDQLWGDFDNDGRIDQYIVHGRDQGNELFWNLGRGSFVDGALAAGVDDFSGRGRESILGDFDSDGFLDIFVVNDFRAGSFRPTALFWNDGDRTFTRQPNDDLIFRARLHGAAADFDLDGLLDIVVTDPWAPSELYHNNGDRTFTDVTTYAFPGIPAALFDAEGVTWADYDDDGDLDLFVCRGNRGVWDYAGLEGDSLRYYAESDIGESKELIFTTGGDSVTVSAIAYDYAPVTAFYGEDGATVTTFPATLALDDVAGEPAALRNSAAGLFLWSNPGAEVDTVHFSVRASDTEFLYVGGALHVGGTGILDWSRSGYSEPPPYASRDWTNRLYRNDGGVFSEVTSRAFSVNDPRANSKGAAWGDYDNDGRLDVYVSNGGTVETGDQPNYLYRNNGDGTFTEVAELEGVVGSSRGMSDGASWVDVNGDGFLDLYLAHGAEHPPFGVGPRELFLNTPNGNRWMSVSLRGTASNGSGIGARLQFFCGEKARWRTRLGESDNGFSNDVAVHVGLGPSRLVDSLTIYWPSGAIDTHKQVSTNRRYVAIEGKPLRVAENPEFLVMSGDLHDELPSGEIRAYEIEIDNPGGLAADYAARIEGPLGEPVAWATISPEASTVFPGGAPPLILTVDATSLAMGGYAARIVFETNGMSGPDTLSVDIQVTSSSVDAPSLSASPSQLVLSSARPNPSRGRMELTIGMPQKGEVEVDALDLAGRRVAKVFSGTLSAGYQPIFWSGLDQSGRKVSSGLYLIRVQAFGTDAARKILILD